MFNFIANLFKREDAQARDIANKAQKAVAHVNGEISALESRLRADFEQFEAAAKAETAKVEAALRAEIDGLKRQITALKGVITKQGGKPKTGR